MEVKIKFYKCVAFGFCRLHLLECISFNLKLASNDFQGFLIRAFILPDEEYLCLTNQLEQMSLHLGDLLSQWEKAYEKLFGTEEMVYNVHLWVLLNS